MLELWTARFRSLNVLQGRASDPWLLPSSGHILGTRPAKNHGLLRPLKTLLLVILGVLSDPLQTLVERAIIAQ